MGLSLAVDTGVSIRSRAEALSLRDCRTFLTAAQTSPSSLVSDHPKD